MQPEMKPSALNGPQPVGDRSGSGRGSRWSGWLVVALAAAGIGLCVYLYSIQVSLLMGDVKSFALCGAGDGQGCLTVAAGSHGSLLGVPLAVWGLMFYVVLAVLGLGGAVFYGDCGPAFIRWAFFLALAGLLFDGYLAYVMIFRLATVCWPCAATYAVNFTLAAALAVPVLREPAPRTPLGDIFPGTGERRGADRYYRDVVKSLLCASVVVGLLTAAGGSHFMSQTLTVNDRERLARIIENLAQQKPQAVPVAGRPAKGADDPKVLVVEFSDFLCPFCSMAAKYIKLAMADTLDFTRFVFRHSPLDSACNRGLSSNMHPGACLLSEGAVCAAEQGRFWEYHDKAFAAGNGVSVEAVIKIAAEIGVDSGTFKTCLDSGRGRMTVLQDIEDAFTAGIRSTPTLVINGRMLRGVPKPWMLIEILEYAAENFPLQ